MTKEEIEKILKTQAQKHDSLYKKMGHVMEALHQRIEGLEQLFHAKNKKETKDDS